MGKLIQNINDVAEKCFGTTVDRLTRDVYRYTHCGAFIAWSESQVTIGSIVEGSDAEFWRSFEYPFDSDEIDHWIADLEKLCDEAWKKVNMNELLKNFTNCDNLTLMSYELRDHDGNVIKEG